MTYELIKQAQAQNEDALLKLIDKFKPMLRKYTRLLNYEDAFSDLQLHFIKLILNTNFAALRSDTEGVLVTYIKNAVYHNYIRLSQLKNHEKRFRNFSDLNERESAYIDYSLSSKDIYFENEFMLADKLTKREFIVLEKFYCFGLTIQDIAFELKISRQSVNQTKKRALKKLRNEVEI